MSRMTSALAVVLAVYSVGPRTEDLQWLKMMEINIGIRDVAPHDYSKQNLKVASRITQGELSVALLIANNFESKRERGSHRRTIRARFAPQSGDTFIQKRCKGRRALTQQIGAHH